MPQIARLGDTSSHGGAIITSSQNVNANGQGVARQADTLLCPFHGPQSLVGCSGTVKANGRGVVRVGDAAACGATIVSGSPNVFAG